MTPNQERLQAEHEKELRQLASIKIGFRALSEAANMEALILAFQKLGRGVTLVLADVEQDIIERNKDRMGS